MKRKTIKMTSLFLAGSIAISGVASASSNGVEPDEDTVKAGITPNSPLLYPLDIGMEKIKYKFADTNEEKAELLVAFSKERYAELLKMAGIDDEKLLEKATANYKEALGKTQAKIGDILVKKKDDILTQEALSTQLEQSTIPNLELEAKLPQEIQTQLEESREVNTLVANGLALVDSEQILLLKGMGLGYDQIITVVVLAEAGGVLHEEIATKIQEGKSYSEIAKELNLEKKEIAQKIVQRSVDAQLESIKEKIELAKKIGDKTGLYDLQLIENKLVQEKAALLSDSAKAELKEATQKAKEKVQEVTQEAVEQSKEEINQTGKEALQKSQEAIKDQIQNSSEIGNQAKETLKGLNPFAK